MYWYYTTAVNSFSHFSRLTLVSIMEVILQEIRDVVLNLQQILTSGNEVGLFVRSTGSCYQSSCNTRADVEEPGQTS